MRKGEREREKEKIPIQKTNKERICFVTSQAMLVSLMHEVRVSPESSGLVNLISCQISHDNESWLAFLA